jgi:biotin carboxylase
LLPVSPPRLPAHALPLTGRYGIDFVARLQHEAGALETTVANVRALDLDVREVMVGCETGVLLADQLSEALDCRGNGTAHSSLRRNKFLQTEAVRNAGLNACGQALADSRDDVERFLREGRHAVGEGEPFKAVVKPVEGAGSDGVFICDSHAEVRQAFASLEGTKNVLGLTNYSVLLQEYLKGDEYVVDTVSRSGVHKCVAIWKYDKRLFNGSPVVYYGMRLMPLDAEPFLVEMVRYVFGVLDTLGIRNGAIHSEVKMEARGPVLIEANCRLHGGEGTWAPMAVGCLGYSAVSAMLDAYLDPLAFAALPVAPARFKAHAMEAKIRSRVSGVLRQIDPAAIRSIRALKSYQSEMVGCAVGKRIQRTVDLLTSCGNVNLVNSSLAQLEADYKEFHTIIDRGIFEVGDARQVAELEAVGVASASPEMPPQVPAGGTSRG